MSPADATTDRRAPLRLLAGDRSARGWLTASLGATTIADAALLGWILLLARAIDRVFLHGAGLTDLSPLLFAMGALLLVRVGGLWAGEVTAARSARHWRSRLRRDLCASLAARDPRRIGGDRVGEVTGTLTTGVEALGTWLTTYVPATVTAVVVPAMVALAVLVLDPPTTLVLLFAGPMLVMLLAVIGGRTAEMTARRFDELGWLRGFYLDMLAGLATLKVFGRSEDATEVIADTSRRFGDTTMEVLRTAFQTSLVMEWAATAATALVAVEVSFRLIGGRLSYGTALAVLLLTPEFFVPFRRLAIQYHAGQTGAAAAASIEALLVGSDTAPVAVPSRRAERPTVAAPPRILFDRVRFHYDERPALHGLDLEVAPGETLALVGASGAGKSTAAALLLRFIEPDGGRILVDGVDLADLDTAAWRRGMAWVPQHPTVFSGSVADNIALGEPNADRSSVERAAADAGATRFIESLPAGFDTLLGEGGTTLSGGQRQRLAIARAFLRDAPVVVLDEFTAHLDTETEAEVLRAAGRLLSDRTALVIAHRTTTARSADRIAVLEHGRIQQTGTDAELRAAGGGWAELCAAGSGPRG